MKPLLKKTLKVGAGMVNPLLNESVVGAAAKGVKAAAKAIKTNAPVAQKAARQVAAVGGNVASLVKKKANKITGFLREKAINRLK